MLHKLGQLEVVDPHIVQSFSTDITDVVNSLITRITNDKSIKNQSNLFVLNFLSHLVKASYN